MKIPVVSQDTWRSLIRAAEDFRRLSPWKYMYDDILFGVKDPHSGDTFYCCVMGAMKQVFGLLAFRGAEGYDVWRRSHEGEADEEGNDIFAQQMGLKIEFVNKSELNDEDQSVINRLGVSLKGKKAYPEFRSLIPGYVPWHISENEARSLLAIFPCASDFVVKFKKNSTEYEDRTDKILVYRPALHLEDGIKIAAEWEAPPPLIEKPVPALPLNVFRLKQLKKAKPSGDPVWECDFFHHVAGNVTDADRPYWMRLAVVAEHNSGVMLNMEALAPEHDANAMLADVLMGAIERHGAKPAEIYVKNPSTAQMLKPLAAELNIAVSANKNLSAMLQVKEALYDMPDVGESADMGEQMSGADSSGIMIPASGSDSRKRKKTESANSEQPALPGFELMEQTLSEFGGKPGKKGPLDMAQDIIYSAWETEPLRQKVALAKKALGISPDCADAYVILADSTANIGEAAALFREGVKAGERAIGKEGFEKFAGHFWGVLETRPYMRARSGLAECLWEGGQREESVEHYKDMLRLNPGDNQGLRYVLAPKLILMGRYNEVEALFKEYEDEGTAEWEYGKALLAFRKNGGGAAAREALAAAVKCNKYVPKYLLAEKRMPIELPQYVGFGDENEAVSYVYGSLEVWKETAGALLWLSSAVKGIKGK